jgi:hypothetical protein
MIRSLSLDQVVYLLKLFLPVYALTKNRKDRFTRRLGRVSNGTNSTGDQLDMHATLAPARSAHQENRSFITSESYSIVIGGNK